ncbi:hypothetical protein [Oryzomicrobium sp.]|uniref:hypothetical protein n=1 Tax=Oryzomicrobium sp. TaxID=1911578 RepID=UPI0025EE53E8|nr:hypothetical protein [Oryzomicrobium sp.]MCE1242592.1 J domain-containing protein [Oryzomicrobium sp.]
MSFRQIGVKNGGRLAMRHRKQVDYYQALNIEFGASQGEIVDAYRHGLERLKQSLIDGTPPQPEILDEMRHAYKVLTTPAARRLYDASYLSWHPGVKGNVSGGQAGENVDVQLESQGYSSRGNVTQNSHENAAVGTSGDEAADSRCKKCRWRPGWQTTVMDNCETEKM